MLLQYVAFVCLVLTLHFRSSDCGVQGLSKFFRTKYKSAWHVTGTKDPTTAKHVAIEMNQILHSNLRGCHDPQHFISKVFCAIDSLLRHVTPTETLILVFDGPAPFAKMQTQRNRRQSSPDASLLTPGTYFMDTTVDMLLCYILQRAKRPALANVTVYVSGPTNPGEGELKIVDWVNTIMPSYNDSIVICGSDSDLIIQVTETPALINQNASISLTEIPVYQ